jgi:dienelactone hydrolase
MSEARDEIPITERWVRLRLPGQERVEVRRDLELAGADGAPLAFDLYLPPSAAASAPPSVAVIVAGYPDPGFSKIVGCSFKAMGSTVSWAELLAASGVAALAYSNREPAADLEAVLTHLRSHAGELGIDGERIGLWASSGNGPLALAAAMGERRPRLRALALCYAYTLDLDGGDVVAGAAATWRFAHPAAGRGVEDLAADLPLLVVRAGGDATPGLNAALDRFAAAALAGDLPVELVNVPGAPHAFDLLLETPDSARAIRRVLAFLAETLAA